MSEIQELDVAIDADGRVTIQVRGVKGERCLALTKALESRLGDVVAREETAEMQAQESAPATVGAPNVQRRE
jgi:hypothetical protein